MEIFTHRLLLVGFLITCSYLAPDYKAVLSCGEIEFIRHTKFSKARYSNESLSNALIGLRERYPACASPLNSPNSTFVVVNARITGDRDFPEEKTALFNLFFGVSGFTGLIINILAVEAYINSTLSEDQRLKRLSLARRKAAGTHISIVT